MKVLVLTQNLIPYPAGFGSAIHVWSLVKTLLDSGHEVHLCCYAFNPARQKAEWVNGDYRLTIEELTRLGVEVRLIEQLPPAPSTLWERRFDMVRKAALPAVSDFYAGPAYSREIAELIDDVRPDAICAWTVDAVAATANTNAATPRLAFLTDLDHLANRFRRRQRPAASAKAKLYRTVDALADRKLAGTTTRLLAGCEAVVDHAAHHCEWLRNNGVSQAKYLPVPVLDEAGDGWLIERSRALAGNAARKISLVGNVAGIATLTGLYLFAREILPRIEGWLGDNAEVHVIGGGRLPTDLANALNRRFVKIRGFVEDIGAEFRSSDIFLVPTPIDLGFRTRIAEAFSYGCCVVAHSANSLGMPELRDGENALLADTGSGLADAIVRCLDQTELREQLGESARETFEQKLDGGLVCRQMIEDIERIATEGSRRRVHVHRSEEKYLAAAEIEPPTSRINPTRT